MMMKETRTMSSPYMNWAKLKSAARFNLASSGVPNVLMKDFPFEKEDLELTYGIYGYEPLIQAIAERSEVKYENVVLSFGTSMANHLAMAAIIERGDEVLIETPAYELIVSTAEFLGANVKFFERRHENKFQIDIEEIEKNITNKTKLIIITNLHNPSSVYTDEETLKEVGSIAAKFGARVLVDEVYLDTMFDDAPRSSFHLGENFVITNSLTKTYGLSGLRCGWILADKDLAMKMNLLNDLFAASNVHIAERLSLIALQNLNIFRNRAKILLDINRPLLNSFFNSHECLEVVKPLYGTTAFPRLLGGDAEKLFSSLREKYETSVVPGRFFYAENHFRIGITCDTEMLREGLERLSAALDEMIGKH
jgi:aspartate/methionine/tyrosine aminotransferase